MKALFFLLLIFSQNFASAATNLEKVDALIESVLQKKELYPSKWSEEGKATLVDLNDKVGTDFPNGIAYAATVSMQIPYPFKKVRELFKDEHGVYAVVSRVKTLRDFHDKEEKPQDITLRLSVKVPVLEDFKTREHVRVYEVAPDKKAPDKDVKGVLDARQSGDEGDLAYNRAYVIAEPDGDKTNVFVIGVHILKPERKVPWLGRGTASGFAKTHYTNYILALRDALK
jgi:hypothetical protein